MKPVPFDCAPSGHGLDLTRDRWDPASGTLELHCVCGFRVRDFPPSPNFYDSRLVTLEANQIQAFRRHLEEAGR